MERDFLGLSSKNPIVVKEGVEGEDSVTAGFGRSSGVPFLFPNKFSGLSHKNASSHFLGRIPVQSRAAASEQWVKNERSNFTTQFTIFYGGSVTVFDDISPEMAQAIIGMAGKVSPKTPAKLVDDHAVNSGNLGLIAASADSGNPSAAAKDDEMVKLEPSKLIATVPSGISSVVPQSRKASLARFLEKRKERAMIAAPYAMNKKPEDGPDGMEVGSSVMSGAGSSSGKEITDDA